MRTLDWEHLFIGHPVFDMLSEAERATILAEDVATERQYEEGERIISQGEIGTSVFVIGRGSADVVLERTDGERVTLCSIGRAELFGEMALIEDRPRAATLVAADKTIVLEIKGNAFLALMRQNADLGMVLLERMSRRLRITDARITDQRICEHEEAIGLLNNKIESALATSDASLKASQTMYDQTSRRANEIIDSADRARNTMKWSLSTAAAVLALLGGFGLWDIKQMRANVQADRIQIQEDRELVRADRDAIAKARAELEAAQGEIQQQQAELEADSDRVKTLLVSIRESADKVRLFTEAAQADQRVTALVEDLRSLSLTEENFDRLTWQLNRFDPETMRRLAAELTKLLVQGKAFHPLLAPLAESPKLKNDNARVFLTYFLSLSALSAGPSSDTYLGYKNSLEYNVMLNSADLVAPTYVAEGDRPMLKHAISRAAGDTDEKLALALQVDNVMDLILRLKSR